MECIVVDPVEIKKCEYGVYKAFSIGGDRVVRDVNNSSLIVALRLTEVSLVDRPANPEALFTMFKAEIQEEENVINKDEVEIDNENLTNKQNFSKLEEEYLIKTEKLESDLVVSNEIITKLESENNDFNDKIVKLENDLKETIAKLEVITKLESDLNSSKDIITKLESENNDLLVKVKQLEDTPEQSRISLFAVNKNVDGLNSDNIIEVEPVLMFGSNQIDKTATAIKKAQILNRGYHKIMKNILVNNKNKKIELGVYGSGS
jgi:predicted RNase H-like nuclease (RuvC/YqgF family)